jgi:hypothetical protein
MKRKRPKKEFRRRQIVSKMVFLLLLVVLAGLGFRIYQFFQTSQLPSKGNLVVGFQSSPIVIASLSPQEKKLNFLLVPTETLMESLDGLGQYRLGAFGQLEEVAQAPFLFKESLESYLSLPIEGWLSGTLNPPPGTDEKSFKKWYQDQARGALRGKVKADLNQLDLFKIWFFSLAIRTPDIEIISLEEDKELQKKVFPDGTVFYELDLEKADILIQEFFSEEEIKKEKLTVGVANATDHSGLGKRASRMITNLGGIVLKIDDWGESLAFSRIRIRPGKEKTLTAEKLALSFGFPIEEGDFNQFLVDVLVIVGEDFWQKFEGK